jgi:mannose-6-phosphate isomerase-like protein (cupin superfamily)
VDAAPQGATHLMWDPAYRFTVMRRPYYEPAKKMNSGQVSHWDDAEMHEDKTQIYIIVGGTGTVALGGTAMNIRDTPEGQHGGQPLVGATLQKVKPGDWIVIPPMTWHQTQPDPGQTFVYGMCHIETRNTRP